MKHKTHRGLFLFIFYLIVIPSLVCAGNYSVGVGRTITVNCTATPPAGYITHAWWSVVSQSDTEYVGFSYNTSDLSCTVYGLKAKTNIKVEVTYAYSYRGSYDNNIHVGHGTYYDYITVTGGVEPTSVTIDQGSDIRMAVGETITVTASLLPKTALTAFAWGTINGFGEPYKFNLTYLGNKCTITANRAGYIQLVCQTENGLVAVSKVTAEDIEPESVSLPTSLTVYIGEKRTLSPILEPKNASTKFTWHIGNDIVEINGNTITPKLVGETTIFCTTSNNLQSNICQLKVQIRDAEDIVMDFDTIYMAVQSTRTINYKISPSNAIQEAVISIFEGKDVVSINGDNSITANKEGKAILLATTDNGLSAPCVIIVKPKLESVEIPKQVTLLYGEQYTLRPIFTPEDAYFGEYSWSIDQNEVVEINNENIIAKSPGCAKISLLVDGNVKAETNVYVKTMSFVNVWTIDGTCIRIPLLETPHLTYSENDSILIKTDKEKFYFALSDIVKITLADENETYDQNLETTELTENEVNDISMDGIDLYNLPTNTKVNIYSVSGQLIQTYSLSGGNFFVDKKSLGKGVYIININNLTFKFIQQ